MAISPELQTDTLCLKPFSEHHLSDRYVSWLNDHATMAFSEQRHRRHTFDSCRQFYLSFASGPHQLWAIEETSTGEHIGNITVSRDVHNRLADIGILIGSRATRGCGYGLTAWRTVLDYLKADQHIYKITGGCIKDNVAMVRIMESCGMTLDCIWKDHYLINDSPVDLAYYSTPGAWKPAEVGKRTSHSASGPST